MGKSEGAAYLSGRWRRRSPPSASAARAAGGRAAPRRERAVGTARGSGARRPRARCWRGAPQWRRRWRPGPPPARAPRPAAVAPPTRTGSSSRPRREKAALTLLRRSAERRLRPPREHEALECLRPEDLSQERRKFDDLLFAVRLAPGRVCDGGRCSLDRCGLSVFDGLVSREEAAELVEHTQLALERHRATGHPQPDVDLHVSARHAYGRGHLRLLELVDRLRLLVAQEAGVPGSWVGVASHFISLSDHRGAERKVKEFHAHCDEGSTSKFHYSAVLWLTGEEEPEGATEGGEIAFWDGGGRRWRREVATQAGRAVVFSSGWENIHQVRPLRGGLRVALTMFTSVGPPSSSSTRMARKCREEPKIVDLDVCEERMVTWLHHMDL